MGTYLIVICKTCNQELQAFCGKLGRGDDCSDLRASAMRDYGYREALEGMHAGHDVIFGTDASGQVGPGYYWNLQENREPTQKEMDDYF